MKKAYLSVFFLLIAFGFLSAQVYPADFFKNRKEIVVSFNLTDNNGKLLQELSRKISIDKVEGNEVTAYVNLFQYQGFLEMGIDFTVEIPPSMLHEPVMRGVHELRGENAWDYYPTYDAYLAMMNQFATDYPNLCEVVNVGVTNEGRDILFIHISSDWDTDNGKPQFMYTSSMHGDELTGYVLMLRLIDYMLTNYGNDPRITSMVDEIDIWINPLANPDGTFAGGNNTVFGATRGNAYGIDFNRNFPDPEDGPHPDGNAYQTETLIFMEFAENHDFMMSANFHGGAEVCNYPWDTWSRLAADDDWWMYVCREYVDTVHTYAPSGYLNDLNNGITNGYAWYTISGGRQDYMNYFHNCREFTMEISEQKTPPADQLPLFWEYNYRSLLNYIEQSLYGYKGIITDNLTGLPVEAKVEIVGHDSDNSWVYSYLPTGNYHRPIKGGSYTLKYSAVGYHAKSFTSISISDKQAKNLDVQLEPITVLTADFVANNTVIPTGTAVTFFSESFGGDIVAWTWTFEGGTPATSVYENPTGIVYNTPGEYSVTLQVRDVDGNTDTETKVGFIKVLDAYTMGNQSVTTCNALFYDSGGDNANYSNNEDYLFTIFPDENEKVAVIEFIDFNVEYESGCNYDYLEIFDGENLSAPLIGKWCGTTSPGKVYATNESGALTVHFYSDNSEVGSGWKALISCDSNVGVVETSLSQYLIFPNPATDLMHVQSKSGNPVQVSLKNLLGEELYNEKLPGLIHQIPVAQYPAGIYLVVLKSLNGTEVRKVMIY